MRLADALAYRTKQETDVVFGVTGGCIVNVVDAFHKAGLKVICTHHEQAAAIMADAYARASGKLGVCFATSGPGGQNLLTGLACAHYDRTPVLAIVGQVPSAHMRNGTRQFGFQQSPNAHTLADVAVFSVNPYLSRFYKQTPERKLACINTAITFAKKYKGVAVVELCDDHQREDVKVCSEQAHIIEPIPAEAPGRPTLINMPQKTTIIIGAGCRTSTKWRSFVRNIGCPILLTWGALDLLSYDDRQNLGTFGVTGSRIGNMILEMSDLILALGTRLDTHEYAGNEHLIRKTILVNEDSGEIAKFKYRKAFCTTIDQFISDAKCINADTTKWLNACRKARKYEKQQNTAPYRLIRKICAATPNNAFIVSDAGQTVTWTFQSWRVKQGQRLITAFNHSPMGYAVPAAVGIAIAAPNTSVVCITGDGGLMMNLATLHNMGELPNITLHVIDNDGYGMIRQTQNDWDSLEKNVACKPPICEKMKCAKTIREVFGIRNAFWHKIPSTSRIAPKLKAGDEFWNMKPYISSNEIRTIREILSIE